MPNRFLYIGSGDLQDALLYMKLAVFCILNLLLVDKIWHPAVMDHKLSGCHLFLQLQNLVNLSRYRCKWRDDLNPSLGFLLPLRAWNRLQHAFLLFRFCDMGRYNMNYMAGVLTCNDPGFFFWGGQYDKEPAVIIYHMSRLTSPISQVVP